MQRIKTKFKKVASTHTGRKIIFGILFFLLVAIAGALWYWNTHKKAILRNKLENAVREKSGGLYNIKFDSLDMDEINGYLSITNMILLTDSTRFQQLKSMGKEPSILMDIHIPEISVSGVKTSRALIDDEIVGRTLEIKNPVIHIIYTNAGKDSSRKVPPKEIYEQLLGNMDLIQADTVLITGAQITTSNVRTKKTNAQIQGINVMLLDVKVDSSSNADTTRILFAKKISISCGKVAWTSDSKLYHYSADSISMSSVSRDFRIKSFRMAPTMNEDAFVRSLPAQDDRFDFSFSNIQLQNIDLLQLFEENLVADSMLVGSASFKIYRDLIIPRDTKNRVGYYPQQSIQRIPASFKVGKVIVSGGFLEYKERNHITRQSGKVQFYSLYGSINNFTNDKKAIAVNNIMTVDLNSRFLNKTPMKVSWVFYLLNPKGRFDVKGSMGPIEGTDLNVLTEPMGPASIKKGRINGAEFNLQGHNYGMDGTVRFLYEDLRVTMLEKDKGVKELDKKSLLSFIANIAIKNSNPKKNEETRVAQVHLDRDINHSIFYLAWKTIFKGLKETAGLKQ
ncbi:MAG TPA: hypothetical protein VK483_16065 [Chitinophagaceae bacterium]|nr:hypothetical protein [Chitinophagaceae bacterium]